MRSGRVVQGCKGLKHKPNNMPLTPAFTFRLDDQILEGTVCVGVYDGKRPTLTAATTGGKIFMWDPYGMEGDGDGEAGGGAQTAGTASTANKHVRYLNINKKITAVTAGRLGGGASEFGTRDVLFVGTGTDVLAYDVRKNRDVFFKDAPEGVTSLRTKTHGDAFDSVGSTTVNPRGVDESILLVGGNCSLQGFDSNGDEVFWTVADDVVRSVCVFKPCDDLVVFGGDDGSIKAIQLARVGYAVREVFELKESHAVSHLVPLTDATSTSNSKNQTVAFAYATKDGAIGVYSNETRVWQEKRGAGKRCTCVVAHDLTGDGACFPITTFCLPDCPYKTDIYFYNLRCGGAYFRVRRRNRGGANGAQRRRALERQVRRPAFRDCQVPEGRHPGGRTGRGRRGW